MVFEIKWITQITSFNVHIVSIGSIHDHDSHNAITIDSVPGSTFFQLLTSLLTTLFMISWTLYSIESLTVVGSNVNMFDTDESPGTCEYNFDACKLNEQLN